MRPPLLDQDDVKAQLNSIVSPYGIHFPDSGSTPSSPLPAAASQHQHHDSSADRESPYTLPSYAIPPCATEILPDTWASLPSSACTPEPDLYQESQQSSLEPSSLECNPILTSTTAPIAARKEPKDTKFGGFIFPKSWKELRQGIRPRTSSVHDAKSARGGSLSPSMTVSRSASRNRNRNRSRFSKGRNAVSDLGSPLDLGPESSLSSSKKWLRSGGGGGGGGGGEGGGGARGSLKARLRSGSLKSLLQKPSSAWSLSDLDTDDHYSAVKKMMPIRGDDNSNNGNDLQGGAVVVDVELIMGLGKMRQYSREDLLAQKQLLQHRKEHHEDEVQEEEEEEEEDQASCLTADASLDVEPTIDQKDSQHLRVPCAKKCTLDMRTLSGHSWRLSMEGEPDVVGTICERSEPNVDTDSLHLRRLMRDSTVAQGAAQSATDALDGSDRLDNTFKVPLRQSVNLASATFDGNLRVPLSLYYVTEELRRRGNMPAVIDEMASESWDKEDPAFDALVDLFDTRPFGQNIDLSSTAPTLSAIACDEPSIHSAVDGLVQSLELESGSTDRSEQTNVIGHEDPQPMNLETSAPSVVTSTNLGRIILRFLADLPDPLIPNDVFATFAAVVQLQTLDSVKIQAASLLVQLLATEQRQLLQFLLEFLDDTALKPLRRKPSQDRDHSTLLVDTTVSSDGVAVEQSPEQQYSERLERLSKVFGVPCSHAGEICSPGASSLSGTKGGGASQDLLYRHYKRDFEQIALQEHILAMTHKAQAVFHCLLTYRTSIFGPDPVLSPASPLPLPVDDLSSDEANEGGVLQIVSDMSGKILPAYTANQGRDMRDMEDDYGYQSDSALCDQPSHRPLSRRRTGTERRQSSRSYQRTYRLSMDKAPLVVATDMDVRGEQSSQKEASSDTICDSAVEVSSVDLFALATMHEHLAMTQRSTRHITRPSLATLHSIMAETDETQEKTNQGPYATINGIEGNHAEKAPQDEDHEGHSCTPGAEPGLDGMTQDDPRDIKKVEREILQSESTTKFLTSNLTGLYPSSVAIPVPMAILPSARPWLASSVKANTASQGQLLPSVEFDEPRTSSRPLTLRPQQAITLPPDHRHASLSDEDCPCSYCTTTVKPSAVPMLTRAEYEKAELQSQCDDKDRHISELLKTVQHLQGQINILNAKLIFLHDHHTTRPMRRRPLVRHSCPTSSSTSLSSERAYLPTRWSSSSISESGDECAEMDPAARSGGGVFGEGLDPSNNSDAHLRGTGGTSGKNKVLGVSGGGGDRQTSLGEGGIDQGDKGVDCAPMHLPLLLGEQSESVSFLDFDAYHGDNINNNNKNSSSNNNSSSSSNNNNNGDNPPTLQSHTTTWQTQRTCQTLPYATAAPTSVDHATGFMDRSTQHRPYALTTREYQFESDLERVLRDMDELEDRAEHDENDEYEPYREGEDGFDEHYYTDAYKTMDQQLHRRPRLPVPPPPPPMSTETYKRHQRMSLPLQTLISKRVSLGSSFRWSRRTAAA
ncbi:hypothetical protein BGZ99_009531 [Dissophora globulifera]|uniref:Rho-GAP domain-containing protein n=1 Tax=Dissophora globulifera TaxID=979702 RepID=A0A9P6UNB2_9FUNG|nr:hypothetical protein BGZ99_009531 [Dissophora globulifera]